MKASASRSPQPRASTWALVLLALAFCVHAVWTPVHLAVTHRIESVLERMAGQHTHAHASDVLGPSHGHHHHGEGGSHGTGPGQEHDSPGEHRHAGDHLLDLLAARAGTESAPLQALPAAAWWSTPPLGPGRLAVAGATEAWGHRPRPPLRSRAPPRT